MSKFTIDDLERYKCQVPGCEEECVLPFPFCAKHDRMRPEDNGRPEKHMTEGLNGVRGGYHRWRQDVVRAVNAIMDQENAA